MSQGGPNSSSGSGSPPVESLTGNSGGPVYPDGSFNIDILGNNSTGIDVIGTPASNLLTIVGIDATESQIGVIEIATDAETIAGAATDLAVVPSSLAAKLGSQTQYALAIGNTTSGALNWTNVGTDGQIPIAATGADPAFASLTSTGATIVYTPGVNSLNLETASTVATSYTTDTGSAVPSLGVLTVAGGTNIATTGAASTVTIDIDGTIAVANGGTGASTLTDHAVLVGSGTSAVSFVGPVAATGALLASNGVGSDPGFTTATYPLTTVVNEILYSSATNTVTGLATANRAVLTTGATGIPVMTALATDGQLIIGSTAGVPAAATLTAGTNVTISNGSNSITINANTAAQIVGVTALTNADSIYTVLSTDYYMSCDVSGGILVINLPNAPTTGRIFVVKDSGGDAATSNITVTTVGGIVTIDGATTFVMNTNYEAANFLFNGTSYEVF